MKEKGTFVVVDGLDSIGKGEIERALIQFEQRLGNAVFDSIAFSRAHRELPSLKDFWNPPKTYYNVVITAEPTYAGVGADIRDEIIKNNSREYSSQSQMDAYALDRLISMKKIVIPALSNGLTVIQSRSVASTLAYQGLKALDEGKDFETVWDNILSLEGNQLQLEFAPDLLIIPTIANVEEVIGRLKQRSVREKDDDTVFDNLEFQQRLKPIYEGAKLKELFESKGTVVEYLDAGRYLDDTKKQTIEIYQKFLNSINRN